MAQSNPNKAHDEKESWEEAEIRKAKAAWQAKFDAVNWAETESMYGIWPNYMQEQIKMAKVKNVTKGFEIEGFVLKSITGGILMQDTDLKMEQNKKYVLLGDNGTGKTTLFDCMATGKIKEIPKHIQIYHCKEIEGDIDAALTVLQTVVLSHDWRNILLKCQAKLRVAVREWLKANQPELAEKWVAAEAEMTKNVGEAKINEDPVPVRWPVPVKEIQELPDFRQLWFNYSTVERQLGQVKSDTALTRAAQMLRVLGFDDAAQQRSTNALSGGLRMRVALCCAFFIEPDILLLDDPTNHLDFPSVLWLENRMRQYRKSFMVVSHDRELLNGVCNAVIHIELKGLHYYNCGFDDFEKQKAKTDKKKSEEVEKFLTMNRSVDPSSALGREKKDKSDWLAMYRAREIMLAGKFTFPPPEPLATDDVGNVLVIAPPEADGTPQPQPGINLIKVDNVRFSYNAAKGLPFIFDTPISTVITTDTRMGVMGPNGAGKSTFLKLITKKLTPDSGAITHHPTAEVAYFAQHHVMELNLQMTPMEFMISVFPLIQNTGLLRNHLGKVGIAGSKADTRMIDLSGGQRSCVMFAKLTYKCPHLLIMDEPTNFLDLVSVDSLIAATRKYKGALLLVSHNRYFLNKCAKAFLSIVPGKFEIYPTLSQCEKATYTFIAEMEAGEDIDTSKLIKKPTDAASVNLAKSMGQEVGADGEKKAVGMKMVLGGGKKVVKAAAPAGSTPAGATPAAAKPADAKPAAASAQARPQSAKPGAKK